MCNNYCSSVNDSVLYYVEYFGVENKKCSGEKNKRAKAKAKIKEKKHQYQNNDYKKGKKRKCFPFFYFFIFVCLASSLRGNMRGLRA